MPKLPRHEKVRELDAIRKKSGTEKGVPLKTPFVGVLVELIFDVGGIRCYRENRGSKTGTKKHAKGGFLTDSGGFQDPKVTDLDVLETPPKTRVFDRFWGPP